MTEERMALFWMAKFGRYSTAVLRKARCGLGWRLQLVQWLVVRMVTLELLAFREAAHQICTTR